MDNKDHGGPVRHKRNFISASMFAPTAAAYYLPVRRRLLQPGAAPAADWR